MGTTLGRAVIGLVGSTSVKAGSGAATAGLGSALTGGAATDSVVPLAGTAAGAAMGGRRSLLGGPKSIRGSKVASLHGYINRRDECRLLRQSHKNGELALGSIL